MLKAYYFYYYKKGYQIVKYSKKTNPTLYTLLIKRLAIINNLDPLNNLNKYN